MSGLRSAEIDRPRTRLAGGLALLTVLGALAGGGCDRGRASETPAEAAPLALYPSARASAEALCAAEPRAWAVLDAAGSIVAQTRGACLGPVEHPEDGTLWHHVAQLQAQQGDQLAELPSWELHLWLDAGGHPRHAELRTPELVTRMRWEADGSLGVRRLGEALVLADAGELWVVPDHAIYVRELMLRLGVGAELDGGSSPGSSAVAVQRGLVPERDALATVELELVRLDAERAEARAGASVLALELPGPVAGLEAARIGPIVSDGRLVARPLPAPAPLRLVLPAVPRHAYVPADTLTLIPVEIPAGSGGAPKLAGELVLDPSADALVRAGRRPGVLFLAGAGPQDRYGHVPESGVDLGSHEIHDALAAAGLVVLRVDDRGVGGSELGDEPTPGFRALVDDGRRALASLAARPEVDPKRILVIGHGEGALQAAILAAEGVRVGGRRHKLAGLVVLAGPGRNLRELIYDEIRASLTGRRDGEIRTVVGRAQRVHDAALAGEDLPASSEAARQWMVEAFAEDPLARLTEVRAPVLAVQGGKDFQVSPERDFGPISAWVEARAAEGSAAVLFPDVDHLLKPEPGTSTPGGYADLRRHVDPAVTATIVAWAVARAGG